LEDHDISPIDEDQALILEEGEPSSYKEAQASAEKLGWESTMEREMISLRDNKRKLVKLPKRQQVIVQRRAWTIMM
jgi:hypothetical protein